MKLRRRMPLLFARLLSTRLLFVRLLFVRMMFTGLLIAVAGVTAAADFDSDSVPATTATLPPFPFFKTPDGLASVFDEKDKTVSFDGQYFIAGDKAVLIEGRVFHDAYALQNDARTYSELEFLKNYENAITALGGKKINDAQYTDAVLGAVGGRDAVEKHHRGAAPIIDYRHDDYLIRSADKEYWIDISVGSIPLYGYVVVLERQAMQQSVGFLDAAAMKKAIDANGHVPLYINFDIDKATLRPDAQAIIAEVQKLLDTDPSLKLSIEGHTDNTGSADHNLQLSASRARSVLGALVGLGVDSARLQSKGHGQDKPIADNATEAGRAKNRRVELVKL
ncbi:MAG: OmpA family protein [Luteimonas sp.]